MMLGFLRVCIFAVTISSIQAAPAVGNALLHEESKLPKSSLYSFDDGVLEGGYSITGNENSASATKGGGAVALNTNYAENIGFNKDPTGVGKTQTAGTTSINSAIQLPVVSQELLHKYGKKKAAGKANPDQPPKL